MHVRVPRSGRAWTFDNAQSPAQSEIRWLGYLEADGPSAMPTSGHAPSMPLMPVRRPDFSLHGIRSEDREEKPPADVVELWQLLAALDTDRRRQFVQVASMWQLALSLGYENQTTSFAWKVVATEALKPSGPHFRNQNVYDVVEGLLGKGVADVLQREGFRPQEVRNAHLHRGEFRGSEFVEHFMMSSFHDPTFDEAHRVLTDISHAAMIEWLRRGGMFVMPAGDRRRGFRRTLKKYAITTGAIAVGFVLGWVSQGMW
jgi:hypothetical protein